MKALTIWQPWASLIMIGAKPFEFRRWDYREREPALEDQRIAVHAGARPVVREEVEEMLDQVESGESSLRGGVHPESAVSLLRKLLAAIDTRDAAMPAYRSALALYHARLRRPRMVGDADPICPQKPEVGFLPLAAVLGTAVLGKPRRVTDLFRGHPDSDRLDHHMFAWPLTEHEVCMPPVPMRGAQGFWQCPETVRTACQNRVRIARGRA